ncbi:MAG TPA: cupredoxin family copper-binding protein [Candidatus Methanoperedens sp.]
MGKSIVILFLILIVLVSGCTSGTNTQPQPVSTQVENTQPASTEVKNTPPKQTAPPPKTEVTVEISDFTFFPPEVTVAKGGTVIWKQKDTEQHTVTGADFSSEKLSQGQTYSHTFNEAGTFEYWCTIHASMRGKVIVR